MTQDKRQHFSAIKIEFNEFRPFRKYELVTLQKKIYVILYHFILYYHIILYYITYYNLWII